MGSTFDQLARRSGALPGTIEREWLALGAARLAAARAIAYHSTSRRYVLNGGLPADVKQALRHLALEASPCSGAI